MLFWFKLSFFTFHTTLNIFEVGSMKEARNSFDIIFFQLGVYMLQIVTYYSIYEICAGTHYTHTCEWVSVDKKGPNMSMEGRAACQNIEPQYLSSSSALVACIYIKERHREASAVRSNSKTFHTIPSPPITAHSPQSYSSKESRAIQQDRQPIGM